ncbi:hypothetical protein [Nocardioides sp. WS12]|uniref:hypothetical protein n=1 Tax=Nocardioides sp. WS12 TaxID=2486272 RepID=UPI0015FB7E6E|nr:hypothetical protein [Nocardioides sp. WS12]
MTETALREDGRVALDNKSRRLNAKAFELIGEIITGCSEIEARLGWLIAEVVAPQEPSRRNVFLLYGNDTMAVKLDRLRAACEAGLPDDDGVPEPPIAHPLLVPRVLEHLAELRTLQQMRNRLVHGEWVKKPDQPEVSRVGSITARGRLKSVVEDLDLHQLSAHRDFVLEVEDATFKLWVAAMFVRQGRNPDKPSERLPR